MKIAFVYPAFERHAEAHPELREFVSADEYIGSPSLGIAQVAANTPEGHEVVFVDDRVHKFDPDAIKADLYALSFFTPAATRALEIGDMLRERGDTVVAGGIFPTAMPELVSEHVDAVVVGEGEAVWPQVVRDAEAGKLQKTYVAPPIEDLSTLPPPRIDLYLDAEDAAYRPDDYPLQISRGCPLKCDACILPLSMGKKIRFHSDDNLVATMKGFAAAGKLMCLTEDTSVTFAYGARRLFRKYLDLVLRLQADGFDVRISYLGISMPMVLHLDQTLLDQLAATGMDRFYLVGGFDSITRQAFGTGDKAALEKAEKTIARAKDAGIDPYVSFLVGNATDDEGVFDRMLEFCQKTELDLAEFVISTPYPGTPIWHRYQQEGRITSTTWKHYNDANVVFTPHNMTADRLQQGYLDLWREFYSGRKKDFEPRERLRKTVQF